VFGFVFAEPLNWREKLASFRSFLQLALSAFIRVHLRPKAFSLSDFPTAVPDSPSRHHLYRPATPLLSARPDPCTTARRKDFLMNDPSTYWLTVTNVGLGIVTLICCVAVAAGIVQEIVARRRKAAALSNMDREVADLLSDSHAFQLPTLGVTMADGGERSAEKETE
jgi:hypothetical protein